MAEGNIRPFSIKIFLPAGDPDGLRLIERSLWTGVGVVFNRSDYKSVATRPEFQRTGVYVLIGPSEDSSLPTIYVGEGDPVKPRLDSHHSNKDFWTWAIFFTTKDNSLNKAHVQFLESRLHQLAKDAKQSRLDNLQSPTPPTLTEAEQADMEGFLLDMLPIFPLVGLSVLETPEPRKTERTLLHIESKGIKATGYEDSKGFIVKLGSQIFGTERNSCPESIKSLRQDLVEQTIVERNGEHFVFKTDYAFNSPSTAAAVIQGGSANGRVEWKTKDGRTLKAVQEAGVEDVQANG
jgi:hypothetical protein